jgi:hypothetical protein
MAIKKKTKTKKATAKFNLYKHPQYGHVKGEPLKLPPTRIVWPYLVEPKEGGTNEDGQVFNDRYECVAVYSKKDKEFQKACEHISSMADAMIELFNTGKKTKVEGYEIGRDGNEYDLEKYPYYKDSTVIQMRKTATAKATPPLVVGTKRTKDGKPKEIDPATIEGGCICAFVVQPTFTANGGLTFQLNVVQLIEDDGTRFGGSISQGVYADLLDFEDAEEEDDEEQEDEEDEAEDSEDDEEEDEEDEEDEDDDDEDEEEDDDDEEETDDDEEEDEDDEEDEKPAPKAKRASKGRPPKRKKAVDVL